MNKWLIVIALVIAAAVTLAFTWRNIPYLNDMILDSGINVPIEELKAKVTETISGNPMAMLGTLGSVGTISSLAIKTLKTRLDQSKAKNILQAVDFQNEKGSLMASFTDIKSQLNGSIGLAKNQFSELQEKYTVDIAKIEDTVKSKDNEILNLSRQLTNVQGQLSTAQLEINKAKEDLIASNIQKAEYQISLAEKTVPTLH